MTPGFSVIIPTYQGVEKIIQLLRDLEGQTFKDFETIVIIDGSTDRTEERIGSARIKLHPISLVSQDNQGRASARNNGIKQATRELLLFCDDDIRITPDCLQKHWDHLHLKPETVLVGNISQKTQSSASNPEFLDYKLFLDSVWKRSFEPSVFQVGPQRYYFSTANLSLSKNTLTRIGTFDESLPDQEDLELSLRILKHDIPIFCDPAIMVWHDGPNDIEQFIDRQRSYRKARMVILRSNPDYQDLLPTHFTFRSSKLASYVFAYSGFWKSVVNHQLWTRFIPRWLRFKIYNVLIAHSI